MLFDMEAEAKREEDGHLDFQVAKQTNLTTFGCLLSHVDFSTDAANYWAYLKDALDSFSRSHDNSGHYA